MPATICIGVHAHAEPERLRATLAFLHANTVPAHSLLLLPDGPDPEMRQALRALDLPQLATDEPRGGAACFNRLAAASDADLLVLLESGCLVGPGWLEALLAALDADPRNGLAGPSTNRAWNEQGVFRGAGGSVDAIAATAAAAAGLGPIALTLEPLYSLGDFCYAVGRAVIEQVGAADEGYGLGPCWEMDYNIRAARAGWRGVWARAAYVYRMPFTARRRREEALRFESSKARYQDKFCALRLRGERPGYEPHCRGDACEHFAPADRIELYLAPPKPFNTIPAEDAPSVAAPADPLALPPPTRSPACPAGQAPLISCMMPTRDRPAYVRQSISYFQRQTYPSAELLIVDDGASDPGPELPSDSRIRYLRAAPGTSIGAKRNQACAAARGELIAHWDDDDWYGPERLQAQAAPILAGEADICGLIADVFFDLPRWEFWRCTPELHRRLFVGDVHGGTLVFRRRVWDRLARYPDRSLAEDAFFLRQATHAGASLHRLAGHGLFVYVRHEHNSWGFRCGAYLDPRGWQRATEPPLPPADRAFYTARTAASPPVGRKAPLVSCIMPTYNRRPFVARAIAYFLRQDYEPKELIVVDDGADRVADQIPTDPRVRYIALPQRLPLGAKRNLACEQAHGEFIAHWDDDDWHGPRRLSYQVGTLQNAAADVCGLNDPLFYDLRDQRAWRYLYPYAERPWLSGNSLCYRRTCWEHRRFPALDVGEDARFIWSLRPEQILALPDPTFHVGMIHGHNVSPKATAQPCWTPYPAAEIHRLLGDDALFYVDQCQGQSD